MQLIRFIFFVIKLPNFVTHNWLSDNLFVFWHQTEQLLEFLHQLPAFTNMTMSVRRELCGVMVFEVVEQAATILLHHKQEVGPPSSPSLYLSLISH